MHTHSIEQWRHEHVFLGAQHAANERRTWAVVALTTTMMVIEIVGGAIFGSMAVLADGWHMGTHAAALAISALAYRVARRHAHDPAFSFGTGKVGELAGFASAVVMAVIAVMIAWESASRLIAPVAIDFTQAIVIAVVGLVVNLVSAWMLTDHDHGHHHGVHRHDHDRDEDDHHTHDHAHHDHAHAHTHHEHAHLDHAHHQDHNLRAAYLHVVADAATSVLAIVALLGGRWFGFTALDPAIGIVGALLIGHWSIGLMRSAGAVLVDAVPDARLAGAVRTRLEIGSDRVSDLHLWRVGPGHVAVVASLVTDDPQPPAHYKHRLVGIDALSHVTVEVNRCPHDHTC